LTTDSAKSSLVDIVSSSFSNLTGFSASPEKAAHQKIEKYLKEEKKAYQKYLNEPKLLILGPSDSGKSTLLKQLKILHGNGFTDEEKSLCKTAILTGILTACKAIVERLTEDEREEKEVLSNLILIDQKFTLFLNMDPTVVENVYRYTALIEDLWSIPMVKDMVLSLPLPDTAS
jgi:hypothetical protein